MLELSDARASYLEAAQSEHGDVVGLGCAVGECGYLVGHVGDELAAGGGGAVGEGGDDAVFGEFVFCDVLCFRDAVGVEEEAVAWVEMGGYRECSVTVRS
jgi:hypothetical protein